MEYKMGIKYSVKRRTSKRKNVGKYLTKLQNIFEIRFVFSQYYDKYTLKNVTV